MLNKKQRIILCVSNDLVTDNRLHKICTSLHNNGFELTLIGRKLAHSKPVPNTPYQTKRMRLLWTKGPLFYVTLNIRLFLNLLFSQADIFTANDLDTLLAVFCAGKIRRKKIVYDSHEYFTEVPELHDKQIQKKIWEHIESYIFPKLKYCSTICQSIAYIYSKKYCVPVQVIRNVPETHTPQTPKKITGIHKPFLIYQGAINKGRGIETMIDAMQYINTLQLVIIGSGDIFDKILTRISTQKLQSKIICTGQISYSELPAYTQGASIGLSLEEDIGLNYHYALPNKIFDYIHAHIPILVSDLPEMRNIVTQYTCGEIVYSRDPKDIAQQIKKMYEPALYQKYVEKSVYAAQTLNWEQEEIKLLELYDRAIKTESTEKLNSK
ncbi:MAG: glycosyltransferase [Bacteroidales bacterium]|jgi:glycosyltransferase involved in cell wall biosynthesis|nr:glycosyltransferase [Bacteroidales bacterium]